MQTIGSIQPTEEYDVAASKPPAFDVSVTRLGGKKEAKRGSSLHVKAVGGSATGTVKVRIVLHLAVEGHVTQQNQVRNFK